MQRDAYTSPTVDSASTLVVAIWMLVAMVVAVRQALDFTTTWRAVVVCVAGWGVMLVLIAVSGGFMSPVGQ